MDTNQPLLPAVSHPRPAHEIATGTEGQVLTRPINDIATVTGVPGFHTALYDIKEVRSCGGCDSPALLLPPCLLPFHPLNAPATLESRFPFSVPPPSKEERAALSG
jgi:hypothetical protein